MTGLYERLARLPIRAEGTKLVHLGWPILLAQSSQTAMGLADSLMASWAGPEELAAIALGAGLWLPVFLSLSGVMLALTPIVAHLVGANHEHRAPLELHQSIALALALGVVALLLLNNAEPVLALLGVEPTLQQKTQAYLHAISWGLPALLLYQAMRSFAEGFGITRPMMLIGLSAVLINVPLNYVLIFGKLGFPELGGVGCGWASAVAFIYMLICSTLYLSYSRRFRSLRLWQRPRINLRATAQHLNIGLPIAFALLIETSMFCFIALLIARYGAEVIAAHQITLSISSFIFMLPLSLCLALTIRVGQLRGAKRNEEARQVALVGLLLALILASFSFTLLTVLAQPLAELYSDSAPVVALAAHLLGLAALYQYSDALQLAATGALRGYKDTRVPLVIAFIAYWLVGLPSGYLLAEVNGLGASGYWYGILIGLSLGAVLLLTRLHKISHHALSQGSSR